MGKWKCQSCGKKLSEGYSYHIAKYDIDLCNSCEKKLYEEMKKQHRVERHIERKLGRKKTKSGFWVKHDKTHV